MTRSPIACLFTIAVLATAGCTSGLYVVDDEEMSGVPFFVKTAMCRQETVYDEPRYTITLIEETGTPAQGKPTNWEETARSSVELALSGFTKARDDSKLIPGPSEEVRQRFEDIVSSACKYTRSGNRTGLELPEAKDRITIAHRGVVETMVDYSNERTINTRRTWSGSTNATIELAKDGTLTTATAEVEDTTLETILDVLPISDYLTKVLDIAGDPEESEEAKLLGQQAKKIEQEASAYNKAIPTEKLLEIERKKKSLPPTRSRIEVKPTVIRHRLWKMTANQPPDCGPVETELKPADSGVSYEQTTITSEKKKTEKKPDENTVKIEGAIQLPKPKPPAAGSE